MESKPKKKQMDPGPEQPTAADQAGVSYVSFEELQDFSPLPTEEELRKTVEVHSVSDDWKLQYECINYLRVLNKYHPDLLLTMLPRLAAFVRGQVDNLRSNLMKNSIMFFAELCGTKRFEQDIAAFVRVVLPQVLIKTTYEKNFIVVEAKKACHNSTVNCSFPETLDVYVEGCQTKNGILAEYSISYLQQTLQHIDHKEYFASLSDSLKSLLKQLVIEVEGKRAKMKKTAESIFKDIKERIGIENVERLLMETYSGEEKAKDITQKVLKLFENKDQKTDKSKDFRSFMKQQKQQAVKETVQQPSDEAQQ